MKTLISENLLRFSNLSISPSTSLFDFRSYAPKNPLSVRFSHRKQIRNPKKSIFISFAASSASNLGGWDDLESSEGPNRSGEFERFQNFLISIGIDDRKHLLLFLTGFVSALAISRVRFSYFAVFPASVLVFIAGFSMGIVRGGGVVRNGSLDFLEKWSSFSVTAEKLREFFSKLDGKMSELKIGMEGAIDSNSIGIGEINRYHGIVESVRLEIMPVRSVVEASFGDGNRLSDSNGQMDFLHNAWNFSNQIVDDQEVERNSNQKSSRRKRESGVMGFDFVKFLGGLFQENSAGLKPHKVKEANKQESKEQLNSVEKNNQIIVSGMNGSVRIEDEGSNPVSNNILGNVNRGSFPQEALDNQTVNGNSKQDTVRPNENGHILSTVKLEPSHTKGFDGSGFKAKKSKVLSKEVNRNSPDIAPSNGKIFGNAASMINGKQFNHSSYQSYKDNVLSFDDGLNNRISGLQFTNEHGNFQKLGHQNQGEAQTPHGKASDPTAQGICQENGKLMVKNGACSQDLKEESVKAMKLEEKTILNNLRYVSDTEQDELPSSSTILDDEEFNRHLKEANGLLKQARECLMVQVDEEMAEILLCKSATLLSRALQMKPMSLRAVGQLGNTYLLHGELKLKKSRELRALLSRSDYSSHEKGSKVLSDRLKYQALSKDKVTSVLVDVCEECEELLVEAGRMYRMALSIDGNDVRALYNWGLALSFRAQLIADVGPETAVDADKIYLAAIDKFDAMVSKSNAYAPDALFRWGVALQLRSHLRPSSSSEKLKLLHQAKRLLEDALHMGSDNPQVREALSSCVSDINCRHL